MTLDIGQMLLPQQRIVQMVLWNGRKYPKTEAPHLQFSDLAGHRRWGKTWVQWCLTSANAFIPLS